MPRNCVNSPDSFCYICGEVTFASEKRNITAVVKDIPPLLWMKSWRSGQKLSSTLLLKQKQLLLLYDSPSCKRNVKNEEMDSGVSKHSISFGPVPHGEELPIPVPPES